MARARIILIDDETDLIEAFAEHLVARGFEAAVAADGHGFEVMAARGKPDLVVLDLNLGREDGRFLLTRIKAAHSVPVIVMTGVSDLVDHVLCLELGADDVVEKPIAPRELAARIEAQLMRRRAGPADLVRFETVTVDLRAALALYDDGREDRLGIGEVMLLRAFLAHPHRVLTREDLLDLAPGVTRDALDRSIDPRISRLKRKLETEWIIARRGQGYVYAPPRGPAGSS